MKRFMTGLLASLWMMSMTAMAGNAAELPVRCSAPGTGNTFTYELVKDGEVVQTLELKDGRSGAFTVTAEDAGTMEYTIRQRRGGNGDIIYDERTYTAVIYADFAYSDAADGELEAEPVIYLDRDGGKLAECSFVNSMKPVVPSEPDRPEEPEEPVEPTKPVKPVKPSDPDLMEMPDDDVPLALPTDRQTGVEAKTALYLKGAAFCGIWIIGSALILIVNKHKEDRDDEIQE